MPKSNDPWLRLLIDAPAAKAPIATAWELTKKGHRVVCTIHEHPLGVEIRVDLDGELHRSEVKRCGPPVLPLPFHVLHFVADWREKWIAKGGPLPPPIGM
jgi:hypothetical protein